MHSRTVPLVLAGMAAGVAIAFLAVNRDARRKVVRWAKIIWDGDEEGEEKRRRFQKIAETVERWSKQLPHLKEVLDSLARETSTDDAVRQRRATMQKKLSASNAELWKAQDMLDELGNADGSAKLDEGDRNLRKSLVTQLEQVMTESDNLATRFKALKPLPAKKEASASEFRGYKVKADGTKTTYFNHDLDEEAKALIGDITPKRLDTVILDTAAGGVSEKDRCSSPLRKASSSSSSSPGPSAWNSAGTFEERGMTLWGKKELTALTEAASFILPNGSSVVEVIKLRNLQGDASIAMVRHKKKHVFDWSFIVDWRIRESQDINSRILCRGSLEYPDVSPDVRNDGSRFEAIMIGTPTPDSPENQALVADYVQSSSKGLQVSIAEKIDAFITKFNTME